MKLTNIRYCNTYNACIKNKACNNSDGCITQLRFGNPSLDSLVHTFIIEIFNKINIKLGTSIQILYKFPSRAYLTYVYNNRLIMFLEYKLYVLH